MDKRQVHNLSFEIEMMSMSLDAAFSLSDEMDHASEHYGKELAAGNEINVEELVRKLKFFSNMMHLQVTNLNDHMKGSKVIIKDLLKTNRI
ncbi:hypothetical protein [Lysinibacillus sp.]|uniref:hypothetical protein n=1 Tax=Lysinibacillus sp. TaxID=1869345 RepID=UPI0028AF320C|nr:hypothetical protein [Lysinibacillus sp.]